jgi:hypothetical protein
MFLIAGCACALSWAETTPNSGVDDVETPPEGQGTEGDPVGVIDGSVLDAAVDVRVECPGIDLVFKRAYGSWSTREGALGYGWSHSFEWRLESRGKKGFTLYAEADPFRAGTGEVYKFPAPDADGESISTTGDMRLRAREGVGHVVTARGGVSHSFDADGRLVAITSPGGMSIHVARQGDRVTRAVHDCGKELRFQYGGGGLASVDVANSDARVLFDYEVDTYDLNASVVNRTRLVCRYSCRSYLMSRQWGTVMSPKHTHCRISWRHYPHYRLLQHHRLVHLW